MIYFAFVFALLLSAAVSQTQTEDADIPTTEPEIFTGANTPTPELEIFIEPDTPTPEPEIYATDGCPEINDVKVVRNGDVCYGFVVNSRRDYTGAERDCEFNKGTLVSITSEQEQQFIMAALTKLNVSSELWIGLHDRKLEGEFVWEDGSEVNYTNWDKDVVLGKYLGYEGREFIWRRLQDCVALDPSTGTWFDRLCSTSFFLSIFSVARRYICQYPVN